MTKRDIKDAIDVIRDEDDICFDVAACYGQIFDNVKHMRWFAEAVAKEIAGEGD